MSISQADLDSLVQTTAAEAGGEPPVGQQAVAAVMLNRAKMSGQTPSEVAAAPHQFEGYAKGQAITPGSAAYNATLNHILPVLTGDAPDPTGGATHFLNPQLQAADGRDQPAWAGAGGTRIGKHVFYHGTYGAPPAGGGGSGGGSTLPSPADIAKWTSGDDDQGAGPAPKPSPMAGPSAMPSPADLGMAPPQQQGVAAPKPDTPDMAAARGMVSGGGNFIEGLNTAANGALFGAIPAVEGGLAAVGAAGRGALHSVGLASAGPFSGPVQAYQDVTRAAHEQDQAYAQAHPMAAGALSGIGALAGAVGGPGKLVLDAAEQGAARVLPAAIPAIAAKVVPRVAAQAGLGALYGAGEGLSNQDSPVDIAKKAATGAAVQGALGSVGEAASPLLKAVPTTAGRTLVGAGVGGALGSLVGHPVAGALMLAGVGAGSEGLSPLNEAVRARATPDALASLSDADIARMQNAPEGALAGEALGDKGSKIVAKAAAENPGLADRIQSAADTRDIQAPERISGQIAQATGVAPETATADAQAAVDAQRTGVAAPLYAKALTGKGVWSDDIADQFKSPAVQKAYGNAKYELRTLGKDAEVPNPDYQSGQAAGGQMKVDPAVFQRWHAEGSNDPARLVEMQNETVGQPKTIPTDEALDLTHRYLRDSFNMMEPASRRVASIASNSFKGAIDDAIPGLSDARAAAGDYLSFQDARERGAALMGNGRTSETEQAFNQRYAGLTPAERTGTLQGFMGDLYRQINGPNFNPNAILKSPKIQGVMNTMMSPDQVAAINRTLQQHAALKASATGLAKAAIPKPHGESIMEGAVIGGADHPSLTGVVGGALSGFGTKAAKGAFNKGFTTKVGRSALAHLMAEDAHTVGQAAAAAKAAKAARAASKTPTQSTLRAVIASANGLGVGR